MSRISFTKQIAVAAGFLALSFAPGISRAQETQQPPAQAQAPDKTQTAPAAPAEQPKGRHGLMAGLNLTDDQKAAIKKIHVSTKEQIDGVNKDESLTADQKQAKIHQLRHTARLQFVKLLTPEQRQQMRANARALRAARQEQKQQQATPTAQPQGQ